MKKYLYFLLLLLPAGWLSAQSVSFTAKSGDTELDASLSEMNASAKLDLGAFKADVSLNFGLPKPKIETLLVTMQPADVFMSAQVAVIIGKPVDDVVLVYNRNKGKGWGVIAKELGIKPGSKEFHQLKDSTKKKNKEWKEKKGKGSSGKGNAESKGKGKK